MERTRFIDHKGKRILLLDYSGLGNSIDELEQEIEKTKLVVSQQQPGSVLGLCDVRKTRISPQAVRAVGDLARFNAPYVKWSAVVLGLSGLYLTAFRAIVAITRRKNLNSFGDFEQAKDWLVAQP